MFKDTLFLILQKILPQACLSRLAGKLANCENAMIKNKLINLAIRRFNIDLSDALIENPTSYASFNDFFTRKLKPEARPIDPNDNSIISPADGKITQAGKITQGKLIQAKGKYFSLKTLTADTMKENYTDFSVIYLSPSDYHRVHMPINGKLTRMTYIPGKLFSVNELTAENIDGLFAKNERLICYFETVIGEVAIVFVGAMLVAGIETVWHKLVAPNYYSKVTHFDYSGQNLCFNKGDEIGLFNFGSTIITLFPENKVAWQEHISSKVNMGQAIATYI
ncbi:archaetidylserine decarboxylase [Cysteiniphilum halobium]|uniref:archaetidylserine decarboxylase n=1 Tax=Cysteiniphilum halobium TaxID=2219059 RepID=UPI000E6591E2|nr:archaetidylserine decarboxylase [Cysteiniphilum halobium]